MKIDVTDMQQVIEELRKQGINIFPLQPKSKVPSGSWKEFQKKKYEGIIPKSSNYAVICGEISDNLVVIDFDECNKLDYIEKIFPNVLENYLVVKTNRGYHVFVKCSKLPNHVKLENKKLGINIDIQSEGRYVVGPGSIHPEGSQYQIVSNTIKIPTIDFQQIIVRLEDLHFRPIKQSQDDAVNLAQAKPEVGQRHDSAIKYCNHLLFSVKLDNVTVKTEVQRWNNNLTTPLPEKELEQIINDCIKYHSEKSQQEQKSDQEKDPLLDNKITDHIMTKYNFLTLKDTKDVLVYQDGVYRPQGEVIIAQECEQLIESCTLYHVREIIGKIHRRTYVKRNLFDNDPDIINFKNCLYNLKTGQTQEHAPDIHCRLQLPVTYDPIARCPEFIRFLVECLEPHDIINVLEQFSSILLRDANLEKAHMYIGDGGNGKSTFFKVMNSFVGFENVVSISIHDLLTNRFAKARLDGKFANIYADIKSSEIKYAGIIKMLISGDRIFAEEKGKTGFEFENSAKFFFSANQLPEIQDDSDANFRRWSITEWSQQFRVKTTQQNILNGILVADSKLIEKLTTQEELSGIANILIGLARGLQHRGSFNHDQSLEDIRKMWKEKADPINNFANNCLEVVKDGVLSKEQVYNKYKQWCDEKNQVVLTLQTFNNRLFKVIHIEAGKGRYNESPNPIALWRGIMFKSVPGVPGVPAPLTRKTNEDENLDLYTSIKPLERPAHLEQNDSESRKESK